MKDSESHSNDKLLRKREVAERWACSLKTVEREVQDRKLTCIRIRGGVRFLESEVNKIINRRNNDF
jgi:excisionase family DNA binding protein